LGRRRDGRSFRRCTGTHRRNGRTGNPPRNASLITSTAGSASRPFALSPGGEASHLIDQCKCLDDLDPTPATDGQERLLRYYGPWVEGMSKRQAQRAIAELMQGVVN
jgi:hypothetical protein